MVWLSSAAVTALVLASVTSIRGADVYLGISRSAGGRIPVAVLGVDATPELSKAAAALRAVIESDLRRSLLFEVMSLPAQSARGAPDVARIKEAGAAGADAVVWGRLTRDKDGGLLWEGK